MIKNKLKYLYLFLCAQISTSLFADSLHSKSPIITSLKYSVVCGYQGWFRCPQDGSGKKRWMHWGSGEFSPKNCTVDMWPDVSEYSKTYPTEFLNADGTTAKVFSSYDEETVELHFKWMSQYNIKAAFVQRFYRHMLRRESDETQVLINCLKMAKKYKVGLVLMYDLSGLKDDEDAGKALTEDWVWLLDTLALTGGENSPYVTLGNRPLVAIWGLGLEGRPAIKTSNIEAFLKFLKEDKTYGGCSIMFGVPAFFRTLDKDAAPDKTLHEFIAKYADIVSPWNVGRYNYNEKMKTVCHGEFPMKEIAKKDMAWCKKNKVAYMPVIHAGFSWRNLMRFRGQDVPFNLIPRNGGKFFWSMANAAADAKAETVFVAMFDEVDEGTAIFKCSSTPPNTGDVKFVGNDNLPSDHYLFLTSKIPELLKKSRSAPMPLRAK